MNREWLRALLGSRPRFDVGIGGIGNPVRQFFMTGAVDALRKRGVVGPRLLEIGSWIGYSTMTWAQAIETSFGGRGTIVCVDPWEDYAIVNQVHGAQVVEAYRSMLASGLTYDLFMHNISHVPKSIQVQPLRGRSDVILPLLREASFDLVFIDGDHTYGAVRRDIEMSLPLLKPGGVLCGDDLELVIDECDAEYARANRDAQPATDPRTNSVFHPGVTLAVHDTLGEVANYRGFWAVGVRDGKATPFDLRGELCFLPRHLGEKQAAEALKDLKQLGIVT